MWADQSVFYQIYPLGLCGAPRENDGAAVPRILQVENWIPHLKKLGIGAVYFSPVFQSDRHGYDTRDYRQIDCRLGSNADFARVCRALHQQGIRVVLDGVFNHVGRGFWAFQDVLKNREASPYRDWFHISFDGDSPYHDGLWYEGWEGHYELVKLNLRNPQVIEHLFSCIRGWTEEFEIDGLRLDVAYCLDGDFLGRLRTFCDSLKAEFFLVGEVLFGDYNRIMGDGLLHSCTNYECYKGLYSSLNDLNLFELAHSLNRQFGSDPYALYRGKRLLSFGDNHDVSRLSSILRQEQHLPLAYGLLFAMPGIPCLYYGSEWGIHGRKEDGDDALRPALAAPEWNDLTQLLSQLSALRRAHKALAYGDYRSVLLTNRQFVLERVWEDERLWIAVNADGVDYRAGGSGGGSAFDLLTGQTVDLSGGYTLPPYSLRYWKLES